MDINSLIEIRDFLKRAQVDHLATVEENQPRVRPFGTINIFEEKLYIQTGKSKNVSKQIMTNPNVELCAFLNGTWLRLSGELVEDDRVSARRSMLEAYPELKSKYCETDDNTQVLYFENATETFSSFSAQDRVIKF